MIETLKTQVRDILAAAFPSCHVQFETIGEDPNVIGVGVYGVPKPFVRWVKKRVHELDERFFADAGYVLLPLVRDLEATRHHYPHLLREWKASPPDVFSVAIDEAIGDAALDNYGPICRRDTWQTRPAVIPAASEDVAHAANEELALAA